MDSQLEREGEGTKSFSALVHEYLYTIIHNKSKRGKRMKEWERGRARYLPEN